MKRQVRRYREESNLGFKVPTTLIGLQIPHEFTKIGLQPFLLHDSGAETGNNRILIFGSKESQLWLNDFDAVFADETFKAAPPIFAQFYVMIGFNETSAFPGLYALLPGKSQVVYETLLREVKKLCPNMKPSRIMTDFETAATNTFRNNFKNAKVIGCFFHFKQALLRRFQKHDAVWKTYNVDLLSTLQIHMIFALTYVPPRDVLKSFDELVSTNFSKLPTMPMRTKTWMNLLQR